MGLCQSSPCETGLLPRLRARGDLLCVQPKRELAFLSQNPSGFFLRRWNFSLFFPSSENVSSARRDVFLTRPASFPLVYHRAAPSRPRALTFPCGVILQVRNDRRKPERLRKKKKADPIDGGFGDPMSRTDRRASAALGTYIWVAG